MKVILWYIWGHFELRFWMNLTHHMWYSNPSMKKPGMAHRMDHVSPIWSVSESPKKTFPSFFTQHRSLFWISVLSVRVHCTGAPTQHPSNRKTTWLGSLEKHLSLKGGLLLCSQIGTVNIPTLFMPCDAYSQKIQMYGKKGHMFMQSAECFCWWCIFPNRK